VARGARARENETEGARALSPDFFSPRAQTSALCGAR
jgi:hypothetical protein